MTEDEKYKSWLLNLKPGDEVAVQYQPYRPYELMNVVKILKSGRIKVDNDHLYRGDNGWVCGSKSAFDYHMIEPVTNEIRESIERTKLISNIICLLNSEKIYKLTTEQLKQISEIMLSKDEL